MFYSETLLSKTGPLARVWLSANLERKLSKTHILQSNIESSVGAIVGQDQAPMALRLSGQLLLGVVRIYSRKARYLLEDCNEALMKIKMAFRPGDVNLPAGATAHTAAQLTLPDAITELDLLLPDPTLDLGDIGELPFDSDAHLSRRQIITLAEDSSQFLQESIEMEVGRRGPEGKDIGFGLQLDDLDLDVGDEAETPRPQRATPEVGRRELPARDFRDDLLSETMEVEYEPEAKRDEPEIGLAPPEEDLGLEFEPGIGFEGEIGLGEGDLTILGAPSEVSRASPVAPLQIEPPESVHEAPSIHDVPHFARDSSESPLSSARSSVVRDLEADLQQQGSFVDISYIDEALREPSEEPEEILAHRRQVRGRRVMVDSVTEIRAKQIKAQQEDRSRILIEPNFLPRDPGLLALLSLQKTRGFVQNVFYPKNIAPELASFLSPEFVRRMAELKRKREGEGEEAMERAEGPSPVKHPRLEIEEGEEEILPPPEDMEERARAEAAASPEEGAGDEMFEFPQPEPAPPMAMEEESFVGLPAPSSPAALPPLEEASPEPEVELPQVAQPLSQQTRAAVHLLREQFSEPLAKKQVVFQDLLPHESTTATDATKMFFEVLVLATKDAIGVKQDGGFGRIEISPKKALWGAWAEEKDEQQIQEEKEQQQEEENAKEGGEGQHRGREMVVGVGRTAAEGTAAA
ncbi:Rec8 like protein-domain-containing protein [Tuber indicum]|nr:Rec8 like protein-domain-containing protein [Tuber indicum]